MKKLIALLMASSLSWCRPHVDAPDAYWVIPATEKLDCCLHVDNLPGSPLMVQMGFSHPFADPPVGYLETNDNAAKMVLKAPSDEAKPGSTVSMGLFRTGLDFGQGSKFTLRATFRRPSPVIEGQGWTFAIVARGGGLIDEPDLSKIQLSFRIRSDDIEPRVQEYQGASIPHKVPIAVPLKKDVVAGNSELITLRLVVDRQAGIGNAFVTIGSSENRVGDENFPLTKFGPDSDTIFRTAGVTLATDTDWGKTLSVEVTDFRICTTTDHC